MNEPPRRPVTPPPARADDPNEANTRVIESTDGQSAGAPNVGSRPTVPSPRRAGASDSDALQRIGDYAITRKIGEGGMGTVYLAEDTRLGRKAAIKTLKPELTANKIDRDRFEREARAAAAVEHDNIVPIWHVGETTGGTPFIAMPFLQGETLADRLKREPVASLGLVVKVAREVADGLAAAHSKGLIHRDIKPGNVWLEGDLSSKQLVEQIRRCKLLDFGLARSVDKDDTQITASGEILGTPAYMAPEQARGEHVDHRADLFSLGVMLYRMATGKPPFKGPSAMAVLISLTNDTPASLSKLAPNLPPALADLIDRLMSKDPAARPRSAAEVSATVRQLVKALQAQKASASGKPAVPVYMLPASAPNPWEDVTEADEEAPIAKVHEPAKRGRALRYVAAGVLTLLALVAVLAVAVIRVETAEGTLVVEITDPDVEARVKNGRLVLVGPDGKEKYAITAAERDKKIDAGVYKVRVEGADGLVLDTSEFTLKKNGQVTVRVTLDPKLAKKKDPPKNGALNLDDERKGAEYALSLGGRVRVNGESKDIKAIADLPKESFRLTEVRLDNKPVTETGLAAFDGCRHIAILNLDVTPVTDAGLAHFKDCKSFTGLSFDGTLATDKGLAYFRGCKELAVLGLWGVSVTDTGVGHFSDCRAMTALNVHGTKVTNDGIALFANCEDLSYLDVSDTAIGDAGLAALKGCTKLTHVYLSATPVTDAAIQTLKECKTLTSLNAEGTKVTDAGLVHLAACKELAELNVAETKVTAKGIDELQKALPGCKITWDGGVIEPTKK